MAAAIRGDVNYNCVKSGLELMGELVDWYKTNTEDTSIGFFQIGGGIAGDFPICVVPLIQQDLKQDCRLWGYFCQISDSTTSYGSYSGAVPNEKITWGKLVRGHATFRHRVRCHDRRAVDFRLRARPVRIHGWARPE